MPERRLGRYPRPWSVAVVVIAAGLVVAAGAVGVALREDSAPPLAAEEEWANFGAVPLSPRADPLIAWTGREAVVFGGTAASGDDRVTHTHDGAIYNPVQDAWRPMAEPPFKLPLAAPAGTWTGSELLVVGTPCRDQLPEEDPSNANCTPGGLEAGAFDPVENAWREVAVPPSVGTRAQHHSIEAIGSTSHGSLFAFKSRHWLRGVDGTWTELPAPPIKTRSLCLVGDTVLAVDYTDDAKYDEQIAALENSPGGIGVTGTLPPPPKQPSAMVAAELDLPAGRWKVIPRTGVDGIAPKRLSSACAPDGAYVYAADTGGDPEASFARYDAIDGSWEPIAAPTVRPGFSPTATFVGDRLLIWGDTLLRYDPAADRWTEDYYVERPTTVVPAGDRALLYDYFGPGRGMVFRTYKR